MTLESTPATYSSVNSPLVYVAYDAHAADPVTYPNYKYVGEVWIGGVKVFTAKAFPHPDTNRGEFDIAAIVREYIQPVFEPDYDISSWEMALNEFVVEVVFKLREEYGGTLGAVVLTDSTRRYYNYYRGLNGVNYFQHARQWLTDRPMGDIIKMPSTLEQYFIPVVPSSTSSYTITVVTNLATHVKTITPASNYTAKHINISPQAIENEFTGAITSAVTGYTVALSGVSPNTYTVELICEGRYDNYVMTFLNAKGGYESMLFNKQSKRSLTTEQKTFKQLPYRVSGAGVVSYSIGGVMYKQQSVFGKKFKRSLMLTTDIISDEEYTWLSQLICSPEVYCETNGAHWPVTITDSNYEEKQYNTHKLTQLSINLDFGESFKTQFS